MVLNGAHKRRSCSKKDFLHLGAIQLRRMTTKTLRLTDTQPWPNTNSTTSINDTIVSLIGLLIYIYIYIYMASSSSCPS